MQTLPPLDTRVTGSCVVVFVIPSRCGKLDWKSVARCKINVPSLGQNARQKGEVAYVKFIDKVRERGA